MKEILTIREPSTHFEHSPACMRSMWKPFT